ncbi:MAG TPA: hypothetical protein VNM24_11785 [Burkholderiales bacterium]|nr:hypothetical protein [Burkholderiales bacterium]
MRKTIGLWSLLAASVLVPPPSAAQAQRERADRLYVRELEGIWIHRKYLETLARSRMPHETARKVQPVVIGIQRQGRSYPIVVTNFDKASVQAVLDVEPGGKPGLYRLVLGPEDRPISASEVRYLWLRGSRNSEGRFDRLEMAELTFMKGQWAEYVFSGKELASRVNRLVLAGKYRDEKGRNWEFSEGGEAYWPDKTFAYELSLNDPKAGCEYLEAEDLKAPDGKQRYGFAWRQGRLQLYPARLVNKKVRCEPRPFAVLTPQ